MLRSRFEVKEMAFPAPEKWKTPLLFFRQILFLLKYGLQPRRSMVMVQFAGYHSFLPCLWAKLTGMKSVVVVGGTDCVAFPSLGYGHFQNPLLGLFTRWSYQLCHVVSAVHNCLFLRQDHYNGEAESQQGILHFLPDAAFRKNVIFNGFDTERFSISRTWEERPELSFLSISVSLTDPVRMKLKGIDMVLALAASMPEARFTLVGSEHSPGQEVPSNVQLLPLVPNQELPGICNEHRFYLQLSLSEGFPNALCEAMACGCIPVVSAVASMPEIVGDLGGIAGQRNLRSIQAAVAEAIDKSAQPGHSEKIAARIAHRYSWENRRNQLIALIEETALAF
jgi:glycosyltransferase involved in cell wall biosynthesis